MVWTNDYSNTNPLHPTKRSIKTRIRKEAEKKKKIGLNRLSN